jgi:glycosyltransferase involved in cell wall biosynthesis
MTLRLAIVTPRPPSSPGGGETVVRELGLALSDAVAVTVLSADTPAGPACPGLRELRLPRVRPPESAGLPGRRELVGEGWLSGLEAALAGLRPQVLLFTPHHALEGHQAARAAERLRLPFVLWPFVHDDHPAHTGRAARAFYRRADLLLACSAAERDGLLAGGVDPARVVLTRCGTAHAWTRLDRRPEPLLLSVGAFSRHKRLEDQIEAVRLLRERGLTLRLVLVGRLEHPRVLEALRRQASRARLEVSFHPDAPTSELLDLHARARAFLFTSASEAFGIALLDALALGTPAVVYPHPVYRGLVAPGQGRVAAAAHPAALADAIAAQLAAPLPAGPDDAWRRFHAWPTVAAELLPRLTALAR